MEHLKTVSHNVVDMYMETSRSSEQVSQTLIGHTATILETRDGWSRIETEDAYRGWSENRWLSPHDHTLVQSTVTAVFADLLALPFAGAPLLTRLSIGSRVAVGNRGDADDYLPVTLPDGLQGWMHYTAFADDLTITDPTKIAAAAADYSKLFLGTPYVWGGSSVFGLDCSGFVQLCYRLAGIVLRRDADIQRDDDRFVPVEQADLMPGDLVFFGKPDNITHIGMQLRDNRFIHSAGGAGVIITAWGDDRYSPGYVDSRRLDPLKANQPVVRFEADDR